MIERYGEAIEVDLFERGGWDLLDFFRGARPWSQLTRIVDTLPAWSRTGRAMADDDELQRYREQRGVSHSRPRPPRITEWSDFDELIATITDVGNLIRTTIAQANAPKGKRYQFKPHRRPKSAAERAAARRERETVEDIVRLVRPRD